MSEEATSDAPAKLDLTKLRVAKRPSATIAREPTYRVSKAQSLRMRAYDKKIEAAEAKKAKAADGPAKPQAAQDVKDEN